MASNYEGGPANLPEAIASGTPMLCTKVGMAVDLVLEGVNGYLLSGNVEQDLPLFERLAVNDQGIVEKLFNSSVQQRTAITWEQVIEQYIEVYRNCISGQKYEFINSKVNMTTS